MRLVFAGTPEVALPSLAAIEQSHHELLAVVTRPDAPSGRGRSLVASPVAEWAGERGLETLKPERAGDADFLRRLGEMRPDCCPVVAYGALLPRRTLDLPPYGWVNLHFSVLPAWRGAAPVQRALLAGDEIAGASTFSIVPELDAGPVYGTLTEFVRPDDTAGNLLARLAEAGAGLLLETLDHIETGDIEARPQSDGDSYAAKIEVDDARVRWTEPAVAVDRRIRACTPDPGAWTTLDDGRVKLGPVRVTDSGGSLKPGEIRAEKHAVRVGTATAEVELGDVQPRGKKQMAAADWARGVRLAAGAAFDAEG